MWKKSKVTDQTAAGQTVTDTEGGHPDDKGIRKKSKVPGVMITQFQEELPEGMTTPDFSRKPIAITIQEGKCAIFKGIVVGTPKPSVTWTRAKGEIVFNPDTCRQNYNESSHEHTLEFPKVAPEDADTYKCYATNEYGRAVCTAVLNVIEVGFSKTKELQKTYGDDIPDFLKRKLKKRPTEEAKEEKAMTPEEKVWEILLSADKKDYERICAEHGITNFRGMLKKLNDMKKEQNEDIAAFVSHMNTLKHIDVDDDDLATLDLEVELKDSKVFLYKDGSMVPFTKEECEEKKHSLKQVGKKHTFTMNNQDVDVEGVSVFAADFKVPDVDFALKIQEVKAEEREDALFICVLTAPLHEIKWFGKNALLSNGEKHEISVSEDKLIHKLIVRDCLPLDAGIYAAVAGIKSCNAWLVVEADKDGSSKGKKAARKSTMAGVGNDEDLLRIAKEQQERYQKEMEEKLEIAKKSQAERDAADEAARLEAQAARKAAADAKAEAKAAAKAAAKAKKAESSKDEPIRRASSAGQRKASVADGEAGAKEPSEDNEEVGENSLFMESVVVDEVKDEEERKKKHEVEGKDHGEETAKQKSGKKSGKKEKHLKVKFADGEDAAVGNYHGEETAAQKSGKKSVRKENTNRPTVKSADSEDAVVGNDHSEEKEKQKSGKKSGKKEKHSKDSEDADVGNDHGEETTEQNSGKSGQTENGSSEKIVNRKDDDDDDEDVQISDDKDDDDDDIAGSDESDEEVEEQPAVGKRVRVRQGPLIEETVIAIGAQQEGISPYPGVHFHIGLSDCKAITGEAAELMCKLSSEDCEGIWYKDGEEIKSTEGITVSKEGSFHKLKIHKATDDDAGKYKFEADGRKTEALIVVEDPPRFDPEELKTFIVPVTVKKGHKATFKLPYRGREPIKVQWYLEGEELSDEANIKIETSDGCTRLLLIKLQRKDSGEVKLKLKNEFGTVEALSELIVMDKPTPPMGPLEVVEASSSAIEFKWRPPKDSGGCKIGNYILERQQIGRNTWKKVGPIGPEAKYRDLDVDHGRRYCYRIRVETEMGTSELMETEDIQAGTKAYPGPPSAPKVVSAFKDCINLSWSPPANTGGTNILGYNLEKRKKGSNLWGQVNPPEEMIRAKGFAVKDVVEGMEYEFRVSAINNSGAGEFSTPSEFVFARDPKKPPGKVLDLKVTDSTYTTLSLSWNKPKDIEGVEDEAKGYFVEIRPAENTDWNRCNSTVLTTNFYTVKGMKSMAMYWVRVIAMNDGGEGEPQELDNYVLAMPPPVRPRFTDAKIKSFMVVRAGNSARFTMNFEASPWPEVTWLKDGVPVSKKVTISNAEGTSQLLIPSAERSDSGIYTIVVKNIVGQETFSIEIRVTDEPKPPGPVEIEENVPGTVTVSWTPSPDEKRDDRLHYMVTKRDSSKRTWHTVADHIFNNKFTACNIMPGREYQFRVYAKNDMGSSKPSESPKWLITNKKERFTVNMPESKACDLQCPPKFLVPLKMHTAPQGYECYMSCALKGDPMPHVTWLRNNISLNTNTNYYISNTCGVCSLLILRVGPKDTGEYKVVAENAMGTAECSTKLTVRE
ncbi:immunoglobulin-like and fibronectin type III domain-containing protein 1 [Dunckerocampus dactyliophorus]|uniref:immunoglobulin-like and fibronectin type III domain-containing protein 1 n=1 Tax=Dunckerocampus dactyliophorus TaxID=161453 RepID=UPI002404AA16|nr:immunoglobulin-like and fibronectin type III domain-containing protein 1 [Dunckerocampus dactyliophorus]